MDFRLSDLTNLDISEKGFESSRAFHLRSRNMTVTQKRKGTGLNSIDIRNFKGNCYLQP